MEIFFKMGEYLHYRLSDNTVQSIDTQHKTFRNMVSLPSGHVRDLKIVSKETFENAKKIIGL